MKYIKLIAREVIYYFKIFFVFPKNTNHKYLLKNGYVVIDNFLIDEEAESLKKELNTHLLNEKIKIISDELKSDFRIFGIEKISKNFEKLINKKVNYYIKKNFNYSFNNCFLMANKLSYKPNNLGSGQGWHRDSEPKDQFKFMIYLDDVSFENGPFQYIRNTHSPLSFLKFFYQKKIKLHHYRFNQQEINNIIDSEHVCKTFDCKKGTAIFFNSRGIHRGQPISKGFRYACTSYFFEKSIPSHIHDNLNV